MAKQDNYFLLDALVLKLEGEVAVHKANIMKFSDGLFLKIAREIAKEYEGQVEFEDKIVDNMCMQLVQHSLKLISRHIGHTNNGIAIRSQKNIQRPAGMSLGVLDKTDQVGIQGGLQFAI